MHSLRLYTWRGAPHRVRRTEIEIHHAWAPRLITRIVARAAHDRRLRKALRRAIAISLVAGVAACGDNARRSWADPTDSALVARGQELYLEHCAVCHGARLEGQPNWKSRLASGRLPAPPHDESGHTWHHTDDVLFAITKHGLVPPYAPDDYQTDMPAFADRLPDRDIWAVLAYIKSQWTSDAVRSARREMLKQTR